MADKFENFYVNLSDPATRAFQITPNDTVDLPQATRGIYTGDAGDLEVILVDDTNSVIFKNIDKGVILPIRVKRVLAAGTTLTWIIGIY